MPVFTKMMMDYSTRIASRGDEETVKILCRKAMGKSDYVIEIVEKTIAAGGLFLALDGRRVVGIANFQKAADGSGWLSMARTDPDYRGKRVAGFLQRVIASHARGQGIRRLRFLVNSSNTPSIRAAQRGGFNPICETAHVSLSLGKHRTKHPGRELRSIRLSNSEARSMISSSRYLTTLNGYFGYGWHFEKASPKVISGISAKEKVFASEDLKTAFLFGCAEVWDPYKSHVEFFILKGTVRKTLHLIREYSASLKFRSIGTFLPYSGYLVRTALRENSFEPDPWANHGIVFEKRI